MQEVDDELILSLFQDNSSKERAFKMLMNKYQKDVYYAIRRIVFLHEDANDVTQNVFIKIWRHLGKFRGDASLKTWITRICVNESLTFIENKRKLLNITDEDYTTKLLQVTSEDKYFSADKIEQLLQAAILKLPEKQRIVRSEEHTSELQSPDHLVCRLLLEKK